MGQQLMGRGVLGAYPWVFQSYPNNGTHGQGNSTLGDVLKAEQIWGGERVKKEWIWGIIFGDRMQFFVSSPSGFGVTVPHQDQQGK